MDHHKSSLDGVAEVEKVPSAGIETISNEKRIHTLGTVRLRHHLTNEIILIPTPLSDPNDPLNWSKGFKLYILSICCAAMLMCNFLGAGAAVAIVEIAVDFGGAAANPANPAALYAWIAKAAYLFSTTALTQGVSNIFWMPMINKWGRRPAYISAFILYFACALWSGLATSYSSELASRIFTGLASGIGECIGPVTIADIFFLHQRGAATAAYAFSLSSGVAFGIVISGLITINYSWRYIYFISSALIGALLLLVIFTFPETAYNRIQKSQDEHASDVGHVNPPKMSYLESLKPVQGTFTDESLSKMFFRPLGMLCMPVILYVTLIYSVCIGFYVAVCTNFAGAYAESYGFAPWQSGLCFIAGIVGSGLGVAVAGNFSDYVADVLTKRNGGIREPEMRLPTLIIPAILTPISLVLYGVGIGHHLHWMVPTVGLGIYSFAVCIAFNVGIVYMVDSYRPICGEAITTLLTFKACFGFLLSFYVNPWIAQDGYVNAFGAMAGIGGGLFLGAIPMYFYGKRLRHWPMTWPFMRWVNWSVDRETGE